MIFKPYPKQNAGTHKWVGKGKWCETKVAGKILVLLRAAEMEQPMEGCFLSRDIYEIVCTDGFFFFCFPLLLVCKILLCYKIPMIYIIQSETVLTTNS